MFVRGTLPQVFKLQVCSTGSISIEFRAEDKQNFTALLKEFRTQLNALTKITGKKYT